MSKVLLLTGSTGFIGRTALLSCLRLGKYSQIVVPVRNKEKLCSQLKEEGISKIPKELHICDFNELGFSGIDHVIHAAGVLFSRDREEYQRINVDATSRLLSSLDGSPRVLLLSSQSAGGPTPAEINVRVESTPDTPLTEYGKSKKDMEDLVLNKFASLVPLILRAPMVLGARDRATKPLFDMARSRFRIKPGLRIKTYSWIAVEDLVTAIFVALESSESVWASQQRIFYVASDKTLTDMELVRVAVDVCGNKSGLLLRLPQLLVKAISYVVDISPNLQQRVPSLTKDRVKEVWPNNWVISPKLFEDQFTWKATRSLKETLLEASKW